MRKIPALVEKLARPIVESMGLMLWDVEFVKEGATQILRVYIDRPEGISTEDCEAVSRALDPLLDEADPIENAYVLEVSSAGLERPLKRPSDFERFMGSLVEVRLYAPRAGARVFTGHLTGYDNGTVTLAEYPDPFLPSELALVKLKFAL